MTIEIPAIYTYSIFDQGLLLRLDDGEIPVPDERCYLRPDLRIISAEAAEPDNGSGVTFDYKIEAVAIRRRFETDQTWLRYGHLDTAKKFLTEFYKEALDALAAEMAAEQMRKQTA